MIRVVLDTNIVVSALLNPHGAPGKTFLALMGSSDIQLCITGAIFAEYEAVLHRPKFRRTSIEVQDALELIQAHGFWVRPEFKVRACLDLFDDMFLECAQAADAHYLVTGNTRHFPETWFGTRIITARHFLESFL